LNVHFFFLGHAFHQRTKSSVFFLSLLKELGTVEEVWTSPDEAVVEDDGLLHRLVTSRAQTYVFWQTEQIAQRLVNLDLGRFILVPMHDASDARPSDFWKSCVDADIICFSRALHERLRALDCRSHAFRYCPPLPPDPWSREPVMDAARCAFFWERRPDQRLNLASVLRLCEQIDVERLHVHQASDFDRLRPYPNPHALGAAHGVTVTTSTWFPEAQAIAQVAASSPIFFAPRAMEGIGMASLEAMTRGQVVVAPNLPTTNEYITHRVNGLLYDLDTLTLSGMTDAELERMSRAALRKARFLRAEWEEDRDRLTSLLLGDGRRWSGFDYSAGFTNTLRRAAANRVWRGT
jgi:hypothetical protein